MNICFLANFNSFLSIWLTWHCCGCISLAECSLLRVFEFLCWHLILLPAHCTAVCCCSGQYCVGRKECESVDLSNGVRGSAYAYPVFLLKTSLKKGLHLAAVMCKSQGVFQLVTNWPITHQIIIKVINYTCSF